MAVLAVMLFIFSSSAQIAEVSSESSGGFTRVFLSVFVEDFDEMSHEKQQELVDSLQFVVRKGAHFSVYFVLGSLCFFAMNTYSIKTKQKAYISILISLIYAISDEIHQIFVPGRAGRITDVFIDLAGILTGVGLSLLSIKIAVKIIKMKKRKAL